MWAKKVRKCLITSNEKCVHKGVEAEKRTNYRNKLLLRTDSKLVHIHLIINWSPKMWFSSPILFVWCCLSLSVCVPFDSHSSLFFSYSVLAFILFSLIFFRRIKSRFSLSSQDLSPKVYPLEWPTKRAIKQMTENISKAKHWIEEFNKYWFWGSAELSRVHELFLFWH